MRSASGRTQSSTAGSVADFDRRLVVNAGRQPDERNVVSQTGPLTLAATPETRLPKSPAAARSAITPSAPATCSCRRLPEREGRSSHLENELNGQDVVEGTPGARTMDRLVANLYQPVAGLAISDHKLVCLATATPLTTVGTFVVDPASQVPARMRDELDLSPSRRFLCCRCHRISFLKMVDLPVKVPVTASELNIQTNSGGGS